MDKKRIVIIGAGLSGLSAAKHLDSERYEIIVLEARDKIGGRIETIYSQGGDIIEMGANWLHQFNQNHPLSAIVQGLTNKELIYELSLNDFFNFKGWIKIKRHAPSLLIKNFFYFPNAFYNFLVNKKLDIKDFATVCWPIEASFKLKDILKKICWGYLPPDYNQHPSDSHQDEENPQWIKYQLKHTTSDEYFLASGFDNILKDLSPSCLLLQATVNQIHQVGSQIKVAYQKDEKNEEISADFVICTLPLGVLQSQKINFNPALSDSKEEAFKHLKMIHVRKFAITFKKEIFEKAARVYTDLKDKRYLYNANIA